MELVEDFAEPGISIVAACAAVGASRATLYRGTRPVPPRAPRQRAPNPRRLGDDERQAIVDAMHSPEFVDQPPMEVFAKLLSRGVYLASFRTFYRVLAELGESKERRNQFRTRTSNPRSPRRRPIKFGPGHARERHQRGGPTPRAPARPQDP
jgi:putative transposase